MADEKDLNQAVEEEQASPMPADEQSPAMDGSEEANSGDNPENQENPDNVVNEGDASEADAEAEMMAMLEDLPDEQGNTSVDDINFNAPQAAKAEFQHLSEPTAKSPLQNIDMLMDINLPISIELGRTKMSINDILALGPGSVVELTKLAGEPVDLLVNQRVVAKGEVVVIDENFGVRITQLMTPEERLRALGEEL